MSLEITTRVDGDVLTLACEGRLETSTAPIFQKALDVVPGETKTLILDFAKLDYTSSAGLRCLLIAYKNQAARGGNLKLVNVCDSVKEVLDMTGFSDILEIE